MQNKYYINYFSKSDGKKIKRPYDPHSLKNNTSLSQVVVIFVRDTGTPVRKV